MIPESRDVYENGDVALEVDHFKHDDSVYWVRSGVAAIMLTDEQLRDLSELLSEWREDRRRSYPTWLRVFAVVILLLIFVPLILGLC